MTGRLPYVFALLTLPAAVAMGGCADDRTSPSNPRSFDSSMFNQKELARYDLAERAYIMGHAVGVYLYGKTLPPYVYEQTGFRYQPGVSAPYARVRYSWPAVMIATAGGTDGNGTGLLYDDVPQPGDGECNTDDVGDPDCTSPPDGVCEDPDDVGDPDCDKDPPPPPIPPVEPPLPPPGGDGDCNEDDVGDPDCEHEQDPDCETFLDPAALQARFLAVDVDPVKVLGRDFAGAELDTYVKQFKRGMNEALHVQDLGENTDSSEIEHLKEYVQYYGACDHSPLVLDLDGDGVEASSVMDGVRFDLLQRGHAVRTAWPSGDDALLVLDRNGDGLITDGGELFGNSLTASGARFDNGFTALATLDENHDGAIDARDAQFTTLRLWQDANRDGVSQPNELRPLASAGLVTLRLAYTTSDARDRFGNALRQQSSFVRTAADGTRIEGALIDVWFRYSPR